MFSLLPPFFFFVSFKILTTRRSIVVKTTGIAELSISYLFIYVFQFSAYLEALHLVLSNKFSSLTAKETMTSIFFFFRFFFSYAECDDVRSTVGRHYYWLRWFFFMFLIHCYIIYDCHVIIRLKKKMTEYYVHYMGGEHDESKRRRNLNVDIYRIFFFICYFLVLT